MREYTLCQAALLSRPRHPAARRQGNHPTPEGALPYCCRSPPLTAKPTAPAAGSSLQGCGLTAAPPPPVSAAAPSPMPSSGLADGAAADAGAATGVEPPPPGGDAPSLSAADATPATAPEVSPVPIAAGAGCCVAEASGTGSGCAAPSADGGSGGEAGLPLRLASAVPGCRPVGATKAPLMPIRSGGAMPVAICVCGGECSR